MIERLEEEGMGSAYMGNALALRSLEMRGELECLGDGK
jgi:hypothetical protein